MSITSRPAGRVRCRCITNDTGWADRPPGDLTSVTWVEVASIPLCLLKPDIQNRRIIDRKLLGGGAVPAPTSQSNSMVVPFSHVRTGQWASVMPALLAETMGLSERIRALRTPTIGEVYPQREPLTPLTATLAIPGPAGRAGSNADAVVGLMRSRTCRG